MAAAIASGGSEELYLRLQSRIPRGRLDRRPTTPTPYNGRLRQAWYSAYAVALKAGLVCEALFESKVVPWACWIGARAFQLPVEEVRCPDPGR